MENALATIKLLPATKKELLVYSEKAKNEILSGYYDALEVAGMLKAMETLLKTLKEDKEIKEYIAEEASKYPEKTINKGNFTITKSDRKTKDYKGICSVLDELYASLEKTKAMIKAREGVIDAGVNPETGEEFGPVPFTTQSVISISIK